MAAKKDPAKIISEQSEVIDIDTVTPYGKNPRKGDVNIIRESLDEHGQFRPILVQRSTGAILGGNHTWKAAKDLGWQTIQATYLDVDDEKAKKIVLVDNRASDAATYDAEILADILSGMKTPTVGTGYDDMAVRGLLAGIQDKDNERVREAITRPPITVDFEGADEGDWDLNAQIKQQDERRRERFESDEPAETIGSGSEVEKMRVAESIAEIQYALEKFELQRFSSSNYWGVPDLRTDMLLDTLPDPLSTWGGQDATPDDGQTTYLWNTGLAASKGLPWDRAIVSFFTYDTKFDSWLDNPGFQIAKMLHNGCTRAIVPDTSFWVDDPRINHLNAAYQAQWLARFMQEAGMKVIPRFMWCDLESIKIGTLGIPKKPPIAAVCIQAIDKKEVDKQMTPEGLRLFVKDIQPEALIVYGGGTAKEVTEKAMLPKELHVVHVDNYAAVRRHVVFDSQTGKTAVEKEQRKRDREAKQALKNQAQAERNQIEEEEREVAAQEA